MNRKVRLSSPARRIVSLVPSQTELVAYLGAEDNLVGITAWCVQPPHLLNNKTVVGGTKDIYLDKVKSLKPDLIIANKEENPAEAIEALAKNMPVYVSDVRSIDSAYSMIKDLGRLSGKLQKATELVNELKEGFKELPPLNKPFSYLYFIWKEPIMAAGPDTFVSKLLSKAGFVNLAPADNGRYPMLSDEDIKRLQPEIILLTSEPYSFTARDLHFYAEKFSPKICQVVNGENLTWYGSRMKYSLGSLKRMIIQTKFIM